MRAVTKVEIPTREQQSSFVSAESRRRTEHPAKRGRDMAKKPKRKAKKAARARKPRAAKGRKVAKPRKRRPTAGKPAVKMTPLTIPEPLPGGTLFE
jgi:hypothetical protein